jgi:hypothetical protein
MNAGNLGNGRMSRSNNKWSSRMSLPRLPRALFGRLPAHVSGGQRPATYSGGPIESDAFEYFMRRLHVAPHANKNAICISVTMHKNGISRLARVVGNHRVRTSRQHIPWGASAFPAAPFSGPLAVARRAGGLQGAPTGPRRIATGRARRFETGRFATHAIVFETRRVP